jgi:hypothetical protein
MTDSEAPVIDINVLLEPYRGAVTIVLGILLLVALMALVLLARRTARLDRRLAGLTRGVNGQSLEAILDAHLDKVFRVAAELDELAARSAVLEATSRQALQRVGIVRFNPFDDTGGNQSFAIALLDGQGDGVILSSLHARAGTRVYAKSMSAGQAETTLSDEEAEALRIALLSTDRSGVRV